METVQAEGKREVTRAVEFYNLDAVIAVGYRVNSLKATHFRIWATNTLREFMVKGFVINDQMLKNGRSFGKDYFSPLPAEPLPRLSISALTAGSRSWG